MSENNKYSSLKEFISNTNLGIIFTAKHLEFTSTFTKQCHLWAVTFDNNKSRIIEEVISPTNKFHEPCFVDLVYEFCSGYKVTKLNEIDIIKKYPNYSESEIQIIKMRGNRFKSFIDENLMLEIANYNYNPKWKFWSTNYLR